MNFFTEGDKVRVLPNKKDGIVTHIKEGGWIFLDNDLYRPYLPPQLRLLEDNEPNTIKCPDLTNTIHLKDGWYRLSYFDERYLDYNKETGKYRWIPTKNYENDIYKTPREGIDFFIGLFWAIIFSLVIYGLIIGLIILFT